MNDKKIKLCSTVKYIFLKKFASCRTLERFPRFFSNWQDARDDPCDIVIGKENN